jgi:hypothetical protein
METPAQKVCDISLALEGFAAEWRHCDIVSNYISRAASFNRADAFAYSNLLSTVVNELLEVAFWRHGPGGPLNLGIWERPPETVIELELPVDGPTKIFLTELVKTIRDGDPQSLYLAELIREQANPSSIGFYELASNYNAKIEIQDQGENLVKLTLAVNLNGEW